jgi:hypothetical protein
MEGVGLKDEISNLKNTKSSVLFPLPSSLLEILQTPLNVIPDESARGGRDPVSSKPLFSLDSGYPPAADSGMTDLVLELKVASSSPPITFC